MKKCHQKNDRKRAVKKAARKRKQAPPVEAVAVAVRPPPPHLPLFTSNKGFIIAALAASMGGSLRSRFR